MSHVDQLKDPLYRNWVKAGLGIKYLHEGIVNYIDTQVKTLQANYLTDIRNNLGNPSATCSSCNLENVLPCPTPEVCLVRRGKPCQFHALQKYTPCPNQICDKIYEKIKADHRYGKPSWKNTDPTKWCTDHWEIGKCFMAETGYYDKQSAVDTDCMGLLSVIVNCLFMATKFDVYLDPPNDIVCKNRKARNEIFHSASMKLTDAERDRYIDDMVSFLKDKKLTANFNVQSAIAKLHQLKVQNLAISVKEEYEVRVEASNLIETLRQEAITAIREKQEESTEALASDAQKALETIREKKNETENAHDAHTKDINQLFNKLTEHGERIEQSLDAKVASIKQTLDICQGDVNAIVKDIQEIKKHHLKKIDDLQMYMQNKKELQTKLYTMYETHLSSVPLSPLLDDIDAHIDDIFVELVLCNDAVHAPKNRRDYITDLREPERKRAKLDTQAGRFYMGYSSFSGKETMVDAYEDILLKDGEKCENVYIVGDAGMGKTTWCIKLLNTWVKVMICKLSEDKRSEILAIHHKTMSQFDCVFFVSLRHASNDSDLLQRINNQLLIEYPELLCISKKVLETEPHKCLVIVDGLDEWIPPKDNVSQSTLRNSDLPTRSCFHGCTVVTTTRPWKLERLRLKDHEINRAFKIQGINDKKLLVDKIIGCLSEKQETEHDDDDAKCNTGTKDSEAFIKLAKDSNISSCMDIPLVLVFLVCLWYDKGSLESSMVRNFSSLIDFLFQISLGNTSYNKKGKLSGVNNLNDYISECESTNSLLHSCLSNKKYCRRFHLLLSKLAKLAHTSLFRQSKEGCLVFTHESLENEFNEIEIDIAVKVGILSQSKVIGKTLSRSSSLSFLHKTIQEFLSAIHIVRSGFECLETTYKKYCCNMDTVYEMENVLFFVSGMSFELAHEMSRHVAIVFKNENNKHTYSFYHKTVNVLNRVTLWLFKCLNELEETTVPSLCYLYTECVIVLKDDNYRKEHLVNLLKYNSPRLTHIYVELPNDSKTIETNELIYMEQIYKCLPDTNTLVMLVLRDVNINDTGIIIDLVKALQSNSMRHLRYFELHNFVKKATSTQEQINVDMQYLAEMDVFLLYGLTSWTFRSQNAIMRNVIIENCTECKVYLRSPEVIKCAKLERCLVDLNDQFTSINDVCTKIMNCEDNSKCNINIYIAYSSLKYNDERATECKVSIDSIIYKLKLSFWESSHLDVKMRYVPIVKRITCFFVKECKINILTHASGLRDIEEKSNLFQCCNSVHFNNMDKTSVLISCCILESLDLFRVQQCHVLLKTSFQRYPAIVRVNDFFKGSLVIQKEKTNDQNMEEPPNLAINCRNVRLFNMVLDNINNDSETGSRCQEVKTTINTPHEQESTNSNKDQHLLHSCEHCFNSQNENLMADRTHVQNENKDVANFRISELIWTESLCSSLNIYVAADINDLTLKTVIAGHLILLNSRVSSITIDDISETSLSLSDNKCDLNNLTHFSFAFSDMLETYRLIRKSLNMLSEALTQSQISGISAIQEEFQEGILNDLYQCLQEEDSILDISDDKQSILDIRSLLSKYLSGVVMVPFLQRLCVCTGLKHLDFDFKTQSKQNFELLEQNISCLTQLKELKLYGSLKPSIRMNFKNLENLSYLKINCVEDKKSLTSLTYLRQIEEFHCTIKSHIALCHLRETIQAFNKIHTLSINASVDPELAFKAVLPLSPELHCSTESNKEPASVIPSSVDNDHWFSHNPNLCSLSLAGSGIKQSIFISLKHSVSLKNLTCSDTNKDNHDALYSIISELLQLENLTVDFIPSVPLAKFAQLKQLKIALEYTGINFSEFQKLISAWLVPTVDFEITLSDVMVECETDVLINCLCCLGDFEPEHEYDGGNSRHCIDNVIFSKTSVSLKERLKERQLFYETAINEGKCYGYHGNCYYTKINYKILSEVMQKLLLC